MGGIVEQWSLSLLFYLVIYLHYSQQVQVKTAPPNAPTFTAVPVAELGL